MSEWPGYDQVITNLTQGDDFYFRFNFRRVPLGQRIVAATLTIKSSPTDSDDAALYQRVITVIADADGNVIDDDGTMPRPNGYGWAKGHWTLPASLSLGWAAGVPIYYGTQVRSSAGRVCEPEHGVIYPTQQITQATT